MAWLNYHHLLYFWTVARTGSVRRANPGRKGCLTADPPSGERSP